MQGAVVSEQHEDEIEPIFPGYLSARQVARRFGVERETVRDWVRKRLLVPARKAGSYVLYRQEDVDSFVPPHVRWKEFMRMRNAEWKSRRDATSDGEPEK
jgi:excisionase family DNA binding protein